MSRISGAWNSIREWWSSRTVDRDKLWPADGTTFNEVLFHAGVLCLQPGDILILKTTRMLTQSQIQGLKEAGKLWVPPDTKVVVLDAGMDLSILRPSQMTELAAP